MRKKTLNRFFDYFFWFLLGVVPLILYVVYVAKNGNFDFTIIDMFESIGFGLVVDSSNVVYTALSSIFGVGGILPFISSNGLLYFLSYFIIVFILHLFIDFVLFIPRLAMKWLDSFYGGDE